MGILNPGEMVVSKVQTLVACSKPIGKANESRLHINASNKEYSRLARPDESGQQEQSPQVAAWELLVEMEAGQSIPRDKQSDRKQITNYAIPPNKSPLFNRLLNMRY